VRVCSQPMVPVRTAVRAHKWCKCKKLYMKGIQAGNEWRHSPLNFNGLCYEKSLQLVWSATLDPMSVSWK
jgi:hypothetical protein